jgi:O-acetyl-ADP-ribose deacetylase (regulator of RNase III)
MRINIGEVRLELVRGDITQEATDAIVNAANSSLLGGGGVDGAIHRAGGPAILEECQRIRSQRGPLPPGEAVLTTGGALQARHVIHTVGPVWRGGREGEAMVLRRCYQSCLQLAREQRLHSLSFPSVSTGAFGYPVDAAAMVALGTVSEEVARDSAGLSLVRFVLFDQTTFDAYCGALHDAPTLTMPARR